MSVLPSVGAVHCIPISCQPVLGACLETSQGPWTSRLMDSAVLYQAIRDAVPEVDNPFLELWICAEDHRKGVGFLHSQSQGLQMHSILPRCAPRFPTVSRHHVEVPRTMERLVLLCKGHGVTGLPKGRLSATLFVMVKRKERFATGQRSSLMRVDVMRKIPRPAHILA